MDILSGDIFSRDIFCPGAFCPGTFCPGTFCPGTFYLGTFCPGTFCPGHFVRDILSGHVVRPLLCADISSRIHKVLRFHSVFCMLIFMPIFWLTCATSVNVFYNPFSCSASKAMSSANLKSPILSPQMSAPLFDSSSAIAIIISRNMLNSKGDKTHPCSTPNHCFKPF